MSNHPHRLVGILESGEIVYISEHDHRSIFFDYLTAEAVEDRNDIDMIKDSYGYLWKEAAENDQTELGLQEFLENLVETELNYSGKYFFGQDDSYTECITDEDRLLLEEFYETDIETFECIGSGWGVTDGKFKKIFNQQLLEEAIEHKKQTAVPKLRLVKQSA